MKRTQKVNKGKRLNVSANISTQNSSRQPAQYLLKTCLNLIIVVAQGVILLN